MLKHIVTLIDRGSGREALIEVQTLTDSFSEVLREINKIRSEKNLRGFEVYESICLSVPF